MDSTSAPPFPFFHYLAAQYRTRHSTIYAYLIGLPMHAYISQSSYDRETGRCTLLVLWDKITFCAIAVRKPSDLERDLYEEAQNMPDGIQACVKQSKQST